MHHYNSKSHYILQLTCLQYNSESPKDAPSPYRVYNWLRYLVGKISNIVRVTPRQRCPPMIRACGQTAGRRKLDPRKVYSSESSLIFAHQRSLLLLLQRVPPLQPIPVAVHFAFVTREAIMSIVIQIFQCRYSPKPGS